MSDIVEMLCAASRHPYNQHGPQEWLAEAADELTRLRTENERLCAALDQIAYCKPHMVGWWVVVLARATLAAQPAPSNTGDTK